MATVCEHCHTFKLFGEKCWFWWQEKKTCSQFRRAQEDDPHVQSVDVPISRLR